MLNPPASSNNYPQPHTPFAYSAAQAYANAIPYTSAVTTALWTPGTRVDKLTAGTGSLTYWLGFQQTYKLYNHALERFYEKHPRFAEQVNQHPILLGIPLAVVGMILGDLVGGIGQSVILNALAHPFAREKMHDALHSEPGNAAAEVLKPVEKFANKLMVKMGIIGAGLAFSAYLLVKLVSDLSGFGRDYQKARKETPYNQMSPYDLGGQVLWERQTGHVPNSATNAQPAFR
jgi:hypothetical protein